MYIAIHGCQRAPRSPAGKRIQPNEHIHLQAMSIYTGISLCKALHSENGGQAAFGLGQKSVPGNGKPGHERYIIAQYCHIWDTSDMSASSGNCPDQGTSAVEALSLSALASQPALSAPVMRLACQRGPMAECKVSCCSHLIWGAGKASMYSIGGFR